MFYLSCFISISIYLCRLESLRNFVWDHSQQTQNHCWFNVVLPSATLDQQWTIKFCRHFMFAGQVLRQYSLRCCLLVNRVGELPWLQCYGCCWVSGIPTTWLGDVLYVSSAQTKREERQQVKVTPNLQAAWPANYMKKNKSARNC